MFRAVIVQMASNLSSANRPQMQSPTQLSLGAPTPLSGISGDRLLASRDSTLCIPSLLFVSRKGPGQGSKFRQPSTMTN